ncbi:MAG: hypothetical protein WCS90_01460 [Bacilli bacterium]
MAKWQKNRGGAQGEKDRGERNDVHFYRFSFFLIDEIKPSLPINYVIRSSKFDLQCPSDVDEKQR